MAEDRRKPTTVQLEYARHLMDELGYDPQEYDIENMTRLKLADLIDDLRNELEG